MVELLFASTWLFYSEPSSSLLLLNEGQPNAGGIRDRRWLGSLPPELGQGHEDQFNGPSKCGHCAGFLQAGEPTANAKTMASR